MHKINRTFVVSASFVFLLVAAMTAPAQTITTLLDFDQTNGSYPDLVSLVQGADGNLYGTTRKGGANGYGTVFKVSPTGTLTTLHSFANDRTDGAHPQAGLALGTDGSFYGTTFDGGVYGNGTVFRITSAGTLTTLHSFDSTGGAQPVAPPVQGTDGSFYGTTTTGGASGYGTVFKITPEGILTVLYSFGVADGHSVNGALVQARNGNFCGTTANGGASGFGTVFEITPSGTLTTLYSFCPQGRICTDGTFPIGGLTMGADGDFYGTTVFGGASRACDGGCGTVFEITSGGTLTTLHSFDSTDGAFPAGGLIQATDGNFYGTAEARGLNGQGAAFEVTPSGTLLSFELTGTGLFPHGGLFQATNGTFYGTTYQGGSSHACSAGCGTIFSLSVGLGPFVETLPSSGKAGTVVKILGTNLAGAISVTFNGTPSEFTINSTATAIDTIVPAGATTGAVQVVTPGGTLSSNVPFRVIQ